MTNKQNEQKKKRIGKKKTTSIIKKEKQTSRCAEQPRSRQTQGPDPVIDEGRGGARQAREGSAAGISQVGRESYR